MKSSLSALLVCLFTVACVTGAQAKTVSFGDTATTWPWAAGRHAPEMSGTDQNGVPNLLGGSFTYDGHVLNAITLNYKDIHYGQSSWNSTWNSLSAGDWYFDVNNDKAWDYVIHKPAQTWDFTTHKLVANTEYHLYQADGYWGYGSNTKYDGNGSNAKFSQYNGYYTNTNNRDWHPTTIKDDGLPYDSEVKKSQRVGKKTVYSYEPQESYFKNIATDIVDLGIVTFDGWDKIGDLNSQGYGSSFWDLTKTVNGGIDLTAFMGETITFAFTMTCANDVLFDQTEVPTPEPASMLLMGAGGLMAAFVRKKAMRAAS